MPRCGPIPGWAAGLLGRLVRKPVVWLSAGVLLVGTLLGIAAVVRGIAG